MVAGTYLIMHFTTNEMLNWRFDVIDEMINQDGHAWRAWGFAAGTCAIIALIGGLAGFYEPCTGGSGMPEIMAYRKPFDLNLLPLSL